METIQQPNLQKARKNHICSWCQLLIRKDEHYFNAAYKENQEFYHWKSHQHCMELVEKVRMLEQADDDGITASHFQEFVYDEFYKICRITDNYTKTKLSWKEVLAEVCKHYNIQYASV